MAPSPGRHGSARPDHLHQHDGESDGPVEPNHDGHWRVNVNADWYQTPPGVERAGVHTARGPGAFVHRAFHHASGRGPVSVAGVCGGTTSFRLCQTTPPAFSFRT